VIGSGKDAVPVLCPDPSGEENPHVPSASRVVIVDDRGTARSLLEGLTRNLEPGVVVKSFGDPRDALAHLQTCVPDLVISDYRMPGMDGIEFTRRIRSAARLASVPIIIVSVVEERPIRRLALENGASDFLTRPIDPQECRARCLNQLRLSRSHKQLAQRAQQLEQQVQQAGREIHARERDALMKLAMAGAYRDAGNGNRHRRISEYARLIAGALGLDEQQCEQIGAAAPLHDIGMIGIPDHILQKPGLHSAEEQAMLRRHPIIGHDLLADSPSPCLQMGAVIALGHHENHDGSGYPHGLAGECIALPARIVAVADVFDALTTASARRSPWSLRNALDHLRARQGRQFEPACVRAFEHQVAAVAEVMSRLRDTPP
jgi:two-component system, response regulator RpfG